MEKINFNNLLESLPRESKTVSRTEGSNFSDTLKKTIQDVNERQVSADQAIEKVIAGEMGIHEGMLKIQEADISLRLLLQVRRKVMDAYTEIIRLQL